MVHLTESEAALALHWGSVYCNLKGNEISANTLQLQKKLQKSLEGTTFHVVAGKVRDVEIDKWSPTHIRYYLRSEGRMMWTIVHFKWADEPDAWVIYRGNRIHNEKRISKDEALKKLRSFDPKIEVS
jgi:hypothetical protein